MKKSKNINFIRYKEVGWALQLWRLKIRYNNQDNYKAISFEWGKYYIV